MEYSINGEAKGQFRLDVLSETLNFCTRQFLEWGGVSSGMSCLDLGCGNGSVSLLISELVGTKGSVKGVDVNPINIEFSKHKGATKKIANMFFEQLDVYQFDEVEKFDVIYSRFLLSHLNRADAVLKKMYGALRVGGVLLIEETDFTGHFSSPKSEAFDRYVSLYQQLLNKRGANANLGKELFRIIPQQGFKDIDVRVQQPVHINGNGKKMAELTFEAIIDSLIAESLVSRSEAAEILSELMLLRFSDDSLISMPRIFQAKAIK